MDVEVAVLMAPFDAFSAPSDVTERTGWDVPWRERPRVTFDVVGDTTIGAVLDDAARHLGIVARGPDGNLLEYPSARLAGVAFFADGEYEGRSKGCRSYPTLGDDGIVRWDEDILDVTIDRAVAAAREGLIAGDPTRIYLIPQSSAGGPGGIEWTAVLHVLRVIDEVLNHVGGDAAGIGVIAGGVLSVWRGGRRVIAKLAQYWSDRGGGLGNVDATIQSRPRTTEETAQLLGCTEEEANQVLRFLGYEAGDDGVWRVSDSPQSVLTRRLLEALWSAVGAGLAWDEADEPRLAAALRAILTDYDPADPPPDEQVRITIYRVVNPAYGRWDIEQ